MHGLFSTDYADATVSPFFTSFLASGSHQGTPLLRHLSPPPRPFPALSPGYTERLFFSSLKSGPEASFPPCSGLIKTSSQQRLVSFHMGISPGSYLRDWKLFSFSSCQNWIRSAHTSDSHWSANFCFAQCPTLNWLPRIRFSCSLCCSNSLSFWTSDFWQFSFSIGLP